MKKTLFIMCLIALCLGNLYAQQARVASGNVPQTISAKAHYTPPPSRDVVYFAGFEGTTGNALPTGWTQTGTSWKTISDGLEVEMAGDPHSPHTGTRMLSRSWVDAGNFWAFSDGFAVTGGETYTVSFWYSAPGWISFGETDDFEVKVGNAQNAGSMTHTVFSHIGTSAPGFNDPYPYSWLHATGTFTPTASGTYHIGIHDMTPSMEGKWILIDDIEVTGATPDPCSPVTDLTVNYTEDCKANLTWTASPSAMGYKILRDGATIADNVTGTSYTDNDFDIEAEHLWAVIALCSGGEESETVSVSKEACYTPPPPCDPVTGEAVTISPTQAVLIWTAVEGAKEYEVSRDGNLLGKPNIPEFTEEGEFEKGETYIWKIKTICENGGESEEVVVSGICVGINDIDKSTFSIAPNPASNNITISSENNFNTVEVLSFLGQVVISQSNVGNNTAEINVSNLTNGIYFVRITSENGISVQKFVKK